MEELESLVLQAQAGNVDAYERLVRRHSRLSRGACVDGQKPTS